MDITAVWNNDTQGADWAFVNGDLQTGLDLETAVVISLFSDRRASADYTPTDGTNDRRGVWFDTYQPYLIGSSLWQLNRAKIVGNTILLQAKNYCTTPLQWMLDIGIASTIRVNTFWLSSNALGITIVIQEPMQSSAQTFTFQWAWNQLATPIPPSVAAVPELVLLDVNFILDQSLLS